MAEDLLGTFGKFDLRSLGLLDGAGDAAFTHAVRLAVRATRAPAATFAILDYETGEVRLRACHGIDLVALGWTAVPIDRSLLGRISSPHDVVAISGASRDPRTRDNPVVRALRAESVLAAPVRCPVDDAVAILAVYDPAARIWSNEEKDAVAAIAAFCTQTILLHAALQTVRIVSRGASRTAAQ